MHKKPLIDPTDDNFGAVLNCAVRYAIGRQTYMPRLVMDFIKPLMPYLSSKAIWCMEKDIRAQESFGERAYGDPKIDKPAWMKFLQMVQTEMAKRGISHA